jgi:cytochrome b involved in lipid metabolism
MKIVTKEDLLLHSSHEDCWVAVHGRVYDVSKFDEHPGGKDVIVSMAGGDATGEFEDIGHSEAARKQALKFFVGRLEGGTPDETAVDGAIPTEEELRLASKSSSMLWLDTKMVVLGSVIVIIGAAFGVLALNSNQTSKK